jgi:hypothetical protein
MLYAKAFSRVTFAVADQIKAMIQPTTVQPKNRLQTQIAELLLCPLQNALIAGTKYIKSASATRNAIGRYPKNVVIISIRHLMRNLKV